MHWRHQMETFSVLLALCARNSPVTANSPHKGQWHGAFMFSLICARKTGWVNNREAGVWRRRGAHYDVIVMISVTSLALHSRPVSIHDDVTTQRHFKHHCPFVSGNHKAPVDVLLKGSVMRRFILLFLLVSRSCCPVDSLVIGNVMSSMWRHWNVIALLSDNQLESIWVNAFRSSKNWYPAQYYSDVM